MTNSGKIRKIHDLVELGKEVGLPDKILNTAKEVTLGYIYSRYPDVHRARNIKGISKDFINYTEEALKWAKKKL